MRWFRPREAYLCTSRGESGARKSHKMKKFARISTLLFFSFTVFTKKQEVDFTPPPFILNKPTFSVSHIGVLKKCNTLFGVPVVGVPRNEYASFGGSRRAAPFLIK